MLKISTSHQPGLSVCNSVWFASSLTRVSLSTDQKLRTWFRKMTNKKRRKHNEMVGGPDVQTEKRRNNMVIWLKVPTRATFWPNVYRQELKKFQRFSPGQVSRRVTRWRGLTRLDYCFHVNAYKHLTAKGLPAAVIQPGVKNNPGSCKEGVRFKQCNWDFNSLWKYPLLQLNTRIWKQQFSFLQLSTVLAITEGKMEIFTHEG